MATVTDRPPRRVMLGLLAVQLIALLVFLIGYFPLKTPMPGYASTNGAPTPAFGRLVIMLIDALRADFMFAPDTNMLFVDRLRRNGDAMAFVARAQIPTVTMPRIKAIVTGSVPGFFDIAANLDSPALLSDNLIAQMEYANMRMIQYGDDTWLKLFPNAFMREDGTTSFFVADYTEVDDNVTRHCMFLRLILDTELVRDDWDVMVLHYLGVDHIGHLAGPRSPLLPVKLREMDQIIERIYNALATADERRGNNTLFVVLGDHGMTEQGNHGGNSQLETQTALLMLSPQYANGRGTPYSAWPSNVDQVDLAPTLAALFGLPIPQDNIGAAIQELLGRHFSVQDHLTILEQNANQMFRLLRNTPSVDSSQLDALEKELIAAKDLYSNHMETKSKTVLYKTALDTYTGLLTRLQRVAMAVFTGYDVGAMCASVMALGISAVIAILHCTGGPCAVVSWKSRTYVTVFFGILALELALAQATCAWASADNLSGSMVCRVRSPFSVLCVAVAILIATCAPSIPPISRLQLSFTAYHVFFLAAAMAHGCSMFATSFVEEEHQTIYCIVSAMHMLQLFWALRVAPTEAWLPVALLACARVLRSYNQTGDKWRHLPGMRDIVTLPEFRAAYFGLFVVAAATALFVCVKASTYCTKGSVVLYNIGACIAVGSASWYRLDEAMLVDESWLLMDKVVVARISYVAIAAMIVLAGSSAYYARHFSMWPWVGIWTVLCLLLHRTHNVVVFPVYALQAYLMRLWMALAKERISHFVVIAAALTYVLGRAAFFYQGNSNSPSTVDISGAYTGMREYAGPEIVGSLTFIVTYSGNIFWAIVLTLFLSQHMLQRSAQEFYQASLTYVSLHLVALVGISLAVLVQRHHLFVWSVMAPRFLYGAMETIFTTLVCFVWSMAASNMPCVSPTKASQK